MITIHFKIGASLNSTTNGVHLGNPM